MSLKAKILYSKYKYTYSYDNNEYLLNYLFI